MWGILFGTALYVFAYPPWSFDALGWLATGPLFLGLRRLGLRYGVGGAMSGSDVGQLADDAQVCSCNNVTKGEITTAIESGEIESVADLKRCTRAGSGCGGCVPLISKILTAEHERFLTVPGQPRRSRLGQGPPRSIVCVPESCPRD